jgi:GAF domain-containing protein
MSSTEAVNVPDAPAVLHRFEAALESVRREFATGRSPESTAADVGRPHGEATATELRRRTTLLVDLMSQRELFMWDPAKATARATEVAAAALDVARVSVWRLEQAAPQVMGIRCVDLFERAAGLHSSGTVLRADTFPTYFKALESERTIAAHDAHSDPRTACFSIPYLTPLGINSMLDVPIWTAGKMIGVVCHEHVGPLRVWSQDDVDFGYLMSAFVAMTIEWSTRHSAAAAE